MSIRLYALVIGLFYIALGVAGFVPQLLSPAPPVMWLEDHGLLLGLFPVNKLRNVLSLCMGAAGLMCAWRISTARSYARVMALLFGALAILGLFPYARSIWGLVPIYGHAVWLHAATALVSGWFAFRQLDAHEERAIDGEEPLREGHRGSL